MKILFFIKSKPDAHLAHALALHLRREGLARSFGAVVYRESGEGRYVRERAGGLFEVVLSESEMWREARSSRAAVKDEELLRLEERYGKPTLWRFVTHDRLLSLRRRGYLYRRGTRFTREELLGHLQARFLLTERLVSEFRPDLVLYAGIDTGPSSALVLYSVASSAGIPVLVPLHTRVGSYMTLVESAFSNADAIRSRYRALRAGGESSSRQAEAERALGLFRDGRLKPEFMKRFIADDEEASWDPFGKQDASRSRRTGRQGLGQFGARMMEVMRREAHRDPLYVPWWKRRMDRLVMRVRRSRLGRSLLFQAPEPGQRYVFFPLHLEPEVGQLLYAPFFTDQLPVVRNVAQSLPHDVCLYVKEHPALLGSRPPADYELLAGFPNVRLLPPFLDSHELIRASEGVVTITGTVGVEAMLLGKPVVTLGDIYYNLVEEAIWHADSFRDLPDLIGRFAEFRPDDSLIVDFLAALIENSVELDLRGLALDLLRSGPEAAESDHRFAVWARYLIARIAGLEAGRGG